MNNYNHFGELLEELRIKHHMTQAEVAEGICTLRQYSRLEKGESTPRIDILYGLSAKYNINLYSYYNIHFSYQSFESYQLIQEMRKCLDLCNLSDLTKIMEAMDDNSEFHSGENYKNKCYVHALVDFFNEEYDSSIENCLKGLDLSNRDDILTLSPTTIYTNIEFILINCLGCTLEKQGATEYSAFCYQLLIDGVDYQLDSVIFSTIKDSKQIIKIYEVAILNLSQMYYDKQQYEQSVNYATKGINFSVQHDYVIILPLYLVRKAYGLIPLKRYEEAKRVTKQAISLYEIQCDFFHSNETDSYKSTAEQARQTIKQFTDLLDLIEQKKNEEASEK